MVLWALKSIAAVVTVGLLLHKMADHRRWRLWERARRLELEAYCTLEFTLPTHGDPRKRTDRAKRLARMMVDWSIFAHSAVFLPDEAGRLVCAGSRGMDDLSLDALADCCERCEREESAPPPHAKEWLIEAARRSFSVPLNVERAGEGMTRPDCASATLIPMRLHRGRLVGVLAVCGSRERRLSVVRSEEAVVPLELLAAKLARTLERAMLMDRLIQVERLAGAAQLTAGVAEALIEPLRDVLDRSELIAGTTTDARTREHARAILAGAAGMSETLNTLRDAWRPPAGLSQPETERQAG